jgi:hypothetical protein
VRRLLLQLLFAILKTLADGKVRIREGRFFLSFPLEELVIVRVLVLHVLIDLLHDLLLVHGECSLFTLHLTFLGLLISLEGNLINLVILCRGCGSLTGLARLTQNQLLLQAELILKLLLPELDLLVSMFLVKLPAESDLLLAMRSLQLKVGVSEHVFLLKSHGLDGFPELGRVEGPLVGQVLELLSLIFVVALDVCLLNQAGVHVLLDEKFEGCFLLDELLHEQVREPLEKGIAGILIEYHEALLLDLREVWLLLVQSD